ncbi:MAG: hypothetical protein ACF8XB_14495 [Planctomycetota bacterium JB042]
MNLLALGLALALPVLGGGRIDFERGALTDAWGAAGEISASRTDVPAAGPDAPPGGPGGKGLAITAGRGGRLFTRPGSLPRDWSSFESLSLWVHRSEAEAAARPASTFEVRFVEEGGGTWFWRKVAVDHVGWARTEVPLRYARWRVRGRVPRWDRIASLALSFRDAATIHVDALAIVDVPDGPGAHLRLDELVDAAFGGEAGASVREVRRPDLEIATDCAAIDLDLLERRLDRARAALRRDWPFLDAPRVPPRLLVFARDEAYRAFFPRFAERLNAAGTPPRSDGFTFFGLATGAYRETYGTLRPTYTHEFAHAWFVRAAGLQNRGEWLQEGLASRVQLELHPQDGFDALVRRARANPRSRSPLRELMNGERIPGDRYWQAATVVGYLLETDELARRLPDLIDRFRVDGSTNVAPHLEETLGFADFDALEAAWGTWCDRESADAPSGE